MPSIPRIIVEVHEDGSSKYIRREMERRGWALNRIHDLKENDFNGDWVLLEVCDYDGTYDCDGGDGY